MHLQKLGVGLNNCNRTIFPRPTGVAVRTSHPCRLFAFACTASSFLPIRQNRTGNVSLLRRPARFSAQRTQLKCSASQQACTVVFKTHRHTAFGEHLRIVGKDVKFGAWDAAAAPTMDWGDGDSWTLVLRLSPGRYVFKCVIFNENTLGALWEEGDDRVLEVEEDSSMLEVCMVFGITSATEISALGSEAASSYLGLSSAETLSPLESLNNFYDDNKSEYNGFTSFTDWNNTKDSLAQERASGFSMADDAQQQSFSLKGVHHVNGSAASKNGNGAGNGNGARPTIWDQYSKTSTIHPEILEVLNDSEGLLSQSMDKGGGFGSGVYDDEVSGQDILNEDLRIKFGLKPYKNGNGGSVSNGNGPPENRIKDLQAELRRANNIRARLKEELSKVVVQSIESQKEVSKLQSEVQTLLTQRNSTLLQLSNMQSAVKESTKDVNRLKAELEGTQHVMKTTVSQLQAEVAEVKSERKGAATEVNRLRTELDMKETELKNQTSALRESIWKLEDEKQEMVGEVTRLMAQLEDKETHLKAQQSALQQTIVTLETEKEQVHGQVGRLRQQLSEKDNELKNQTAALRQNIIKLEEGKAELIDELHRLREQLEDKEATFKSQLSAQHSTIYELENEGARQANEVKFLKQRIEEKEHGLEAQARELKQAIETLEEEKKRTANEVSVLRDQLSEKHKALQSLTQAHTAELSQQIAVLESERQEALDEIDKLHNAITHLQYDKERALNDVARLKDMLESKESEFSRIAADLQSRMDRMERQLAESESDRQRLKGEVNRMAVETISLENARAAQMQQIREMEMDRKRAMEELSGLRAELANHSHSSWSSGGWGSSSSAGDEVLHQLQSRVQLLETELRESESERSRLKDEMNRLAVASLGGGSSVDLDKLRTAEEAHRRAMQQIADLQQLLSGKEAELARQQGNLKEVESELNNRGFSYDWWSTAFQNDGYDRNGVVNNGTGGFWDSTPSRGSTESSSDSFDWMQPSVDNSQEDSNAWQEGETHWYVKQMEQEAAAAAAASSAASSQNGVWGTQEDDTTSPWDAALSSALQGSGGWDDDQRTHWFVKQMEEEKAAAEQVQDDVRGEVQEQHGQESWDDDNRVHWYVRQMEAEMQRTSGVWEDDQQQQNTDPRQEWDNNERTHWFFQQQQEAEPQNGSSSRHDIYDDLPIDVHGFLLHEEELSEAQQELLHDTVRALHDENNLVSGEIDAIRQTIRKMETEKVEAMTEVARLLEKIKSRKDNSVNNTRSRW